jgi:L-aspartate oxidase
MQIATRFDVIIIGGGAAGLYAALCLPSHYQIALITKDELPLSASDWAQGGIAAAIDHNDSAQLHLEDTLKAGAGLCDLEAVKFLVEQAPVCIESLLELGVNFDRRGESLALTLEAAHSRPRVLHAADTTGRAMVSKLSAEVLNRPNIQVISQAFALDLYCGPQASGDKGGRCQGISLIYKNNLIFVKSAAVILATGGGGQVFAKTTNPSVSTGDGVAIAYRAGALLRDLEFFQFHPTALNLEGAPHFLISEAVRGEGAHLIDAEGRRFAFDYHPQGELAPRDIVSRAIFSHLQKTAEDPSTANVWLDLRPIPEDKIRYRFPNIIHVCKQWGIDVFTQPVPVSPAAHYWMGGIYTNIYNQTSLQGLYALGETASTGVHGANRLASNSLLECLVFGRQMQDLSLDIHTQEENHQLPPITYNFPDWDRQKTQIAQIRAELPRLMWQSAGICREQNTLNTAIAQVAKMQTEFINMPCSKFLTQISPIQAVHLAIPAAASELRQWGETYNLLTVADLILKSAVFRTESRGGHYRSDFPNTDSNWQVHTLVENNQWNKS